MVSLLHVRLNHRGRDAAGAAPVPAIAVGGLPVT
jgi:hypothetical protein